jgi:hypothetical protein
MTEETETIPAADDMPKPKKRGGRRKRKSEPVAPEDMTTYVVCVKYQGEWEKLRDMVEAEAEKLDADMQPIQALPMARLDERCMVRGAFFIGDEKHGTRRPFLTDPIRVDEHWTPGRDGYGGELSVPTFLEAFGKLCLPFNGAEGGCSIKRTAKDELRIAYG